MNRADLSNLAVTHQFPIRQFEDAWRLHQRGAAIKIGILPND